MSYSGVHLRNLLKSWGMYHDKPPPQDYRRSEQAPEKLFQRLQATAEVLAMWQCSGQDIVFGFADESSPEANSNKARWWSFYKKPRKVNTDTRKVNTDKTCLITPLAFMPYKEKVL